MTVGSPGNGWNPGYWAKYTPSIAGPTGRYGHRGCPSPPKSTGSPRNWTGTFGWDLRRCGITTRPIFPLNGGAFGTLAQAHWAIWAAISWKPPFPSWTWRIP